MKLTGVAVAVVTVTLLFLAATIIRIIPIMAIMTPTTSVAIGRDVELGTAPTGRVEFFLLTIYHQIAPTIAIIIPITRIITPTAVETI